jgi:hypothetical protein
MSFKQTVLCASVILAAMYANAEENELVNPPTAESTMAMEASKPAEPIGAKINMSTTYVDLQGTEEAKGNIYSFGNTTATYHTFFGTYALPKSTWNLHFLSQYIQNYVETDISGTLYKDKTQGFSDTRIFTSKLFVLNGENFVVAEAGLNLPTGSINKDNESISGLHYAYNMQMGSGTVDPVVALTYMNKQKDVTSLVRTQAIVRTYNNSNDYHLGNDFQTTASSEYQVIKHLAPAVKANYRNKNAISGEDKTLGRNYLTEFYYHDQINWDLTVALKSQWEVGSNLNLNLEAGRPILQRMSNIDDVQVAAQFYGSAGLEGTF